MFQNKCPCVFMCKKMWNDVNLECAHWQPLAFARFWWSISLMFFSAFSTFLSRVSSLRLIFFWSSRAQLITTAWNLWSMGTGTVGASVRQAACRASSFSRPLCMLSSSFCTTSSMMDVALFRASSCWGFLTVPTETSTTSVRPIRRLAVSSSSSLSPGAQKTQVSQKTSPFFTNLARAFLICWKIVDHAACLSVSQSVIHYSSCSKALPLEHEVLQRCHSCDREQPHQHRCCAFLVRSEWTESFPWWTPFPVPARTQLRAKPPPCQDTREADFLHFSRK